MGLFKSWGKKAKMGKGGYSFKLDDSQTVYFKGDGVTPEDAGYIAGYFQSYHSIMDLVNKTSKYNVQLSAATMNDPIQLGFIVNSTDVDDETVEYFKSSAEALQNNYPGRLINIALLDTSFETLKVL